jgi:hypothetical protein
MKVRKIFGETELPLDFRRYPSYSCTLMEYPGEGHCEITVRLCKSKGKLKLTLLRTGHEDPEGE